MEKIKVFVTITTEYLNRLKKQNKRLWETLCHELPEKYPDNCEVCKGANCGVRGNENIIEGVVMCDYCHAKDLNSQKVD